MSKPVQWHMSHEMHAGILNTIRESPGRDQSAPFTVEVTAENIANGIRGKSEQCPVGLALKRHGLPISKCQMTRSTKLTVYGFMEDFDKGREVAPFLFQVEGVCHG